MHVIAAINGQLSSEISAHYALHFAQVNNLPLILFHVRNPSDSIDAVNSSMVNIEESAERYGVEIERVILSGPPIETIKRYVSDNKSEIIFCSARYRQSKKTFKLSFSEKLSTMVLPADMAVVRVVQAHSTLLTEKIVLPIKKDRLPLELFTFFASIAKAYNASGEIYSVTVTSRKKRARLELGDIKRALYNIDHSLSCFKHLAHHMAIPLRLKHAIAQKETDQVLHHLSHTDFDLMIISGKRVSSFFHLLRARSITRLQRHTPVNLISYYFREKIR